MKHLQVLFLLFVLTIFVNCSPRVVPVADVRVDSVYIARVQRDTIYEKDSVLVYTQADTIHKEKYRYVYRDRLVTDTLYKELRDTINTIVEVEKKLSKVEEMQMEIGKGVMWAVPMVLLLWLVYRRFT
jgi:hypothetical protein